MPCCVGHGGALPPADQRGPDWEFGDTADAVAEVVWCESCGEGMIVCGLGMRPVLTGVEPLEGVVVELTSEGESVWECAVAEDSQGFGFGNLVHVADEDDVAFFRFALGAQEGWEDVGEEGVAEEVFVSPGACAERGTWIGDDFVDDLAVEVFKSVPVFLEIERFGATGECCV